MGLLGGGLLGATGTAGPLIVTYLHSIRMSRPSFIHMMSLTFTVFGLIQLVTLVVLGAFTPERTVRRYGRSSPLTAVTVVGIRIGRLTQPEDIRAGGPRLAGIRCGSPALSALG